MGSVPDPTAAFSYQLEYWVIAKVPQSTSAVCLRNNMLRKSYKTAQQTTFIKQFQTCTQFSNTIIKFQEIKCLK